MTLDPLSRRIIGALQVDGRASWARIAEVLDESPRTVARRGNALIASGRVRVVALRGDRSFQLVRFRCFPAMTHDIARTVASWPETVFVSRLASCPEVVAEVRSGPAQLREDICRRIDGLAGVLDYSAHAVVAYHRTLAQWRAGLISADEEATLEPTPPTPDAWSAVEPTLDPVEQAIVDALVADGRTTIDELARTTGSSEATVRRRLESLVARGAVYVRALVDPHLIDLPVEALVTIACSTADSVTIGAQLADSTLVRYAVTTLGGRTLVADVAAADLTALHALATSLDRAHDVAVQLVRDTFKRSGVLTTLS